MKSLPKNKIHSAYIAGAALFLAAALFGLLFGSTRVGFADIFDALCGKSDTPEARIIIFVRLPRTLAALLVGAALSVAGAVLQGVLENRLASPRIIGVNSGAGLAVTLAMALGTLGGWRLSLAAFVGAFGAAIIVSLAARKWGASRGTVILIGVAMNSFLGAISDTVKTLIPEIGVMSNDFKMGSFSSVTYSELAPAALMILLSLAVLFSLANELDVLRLGEHSARALGMSTRTTRVIFLLLSALLAGASVSIAGLISFIGLIVPHAVKAIAGNRSASLLPLSALFGGAFVSLSDTAARVIFAPYEVPVGILTAFIGAPFFVFILVKRRKA